MTTATARACANIALVKYWGKRDAALNLPAAGSLSLTLEALVTETTVTFDHALAQDEMSLDGATARPGDLAKTSTFLDLVRTRAGIRTRARVISANHFPTASGLASSASGFAALALAATTAASLQLTSQELSILARQGSGSAARSIFGGFCRMHAGAFADGSDAFAEPIADPHSLLPTIRMVIGVVGGGAPKSHGSRDAMDHTATTSPFYRAWIDIVPHDLAAAESHIAGGDLASLGTLAEANAIAMHASAMAARPAVIYWQPTTLQLLAEVRALRARDVPAWATMDAGPHVKVLTTSDYANDVVASLLAGGATEAIISGPGRAASLVKGHAV